MKRVLLIDANALVHAAWHGYPERLGPDQRCYRVVHGFLSKLHRLERDYEWDKWLAVFDPEGGSLYRKALYPDYKANRPEMDPDLRRQKEELEQALERFGVPKLKVHGVETDDVIGSIATKEAASGNLVAIMSPDKDMGQLVTERIGLLRPIKGEAGIQTPFDYLDEQGVRARYGVWPKQMADWLALIGDSADNIPGVDKVGPKTAAKLLEEHGDLRTLLTRADQIRGVVGENLRNSKSVLLLAQKLTTIQVDLDVPDWTSPTVDEVTLRQEQERFGLPSWMGAFMSAGMAGGDRENQSPNAGDESPF